MKTFLVALLAVSFFGCAHSPSSDAPKNNEMAMTEAPEVPMRTPAADVEMYTLSESRPSVNFERCKGTASLTRVGDRLTLQIRGSNCANLVINGNEEHKLGGTGSDDRFIDVNFNEETDRTVKVTIASNKYIDTNGAKGNADIFFIRVKARIPMTTLNLKWSGDTAEYRLQRCGGTVEAKIANRTLNVIFRDMQYCNLFDILSNEGSSLSYDSKPVQRQGNGFGGSFSIPKKFVDYGTNAVIVQVYSVSGAKERVKLLFNAN